MTPTYPIIWRHPDGRSIEMYAEHKLRIGFPHPLTRLDRWAILYRREVPNLTDDEWIATPGPEWTKE